MIANDEAYRSVQQQQQQDQPQQVPVGDAEVSRRGSKGRGPRAGAGARCVSHETKRCSRPWMERKSAVVGLVEVMGKEEGGKSARTREQRPFIPFSAHQGGQMTASHPPSIGHEARRPRSRGQ